MGSLLIAFALVVNSQAHMQHNASLETIDIQAAREFNALIDTNVEELFSRAEQAYKDAAQKPSNLTLLYRAALLRMYVDPCFNGGKFKYDRQLLSQIKACKLGQTYEEQKLLLLYRESDWGTNEDYKLGTRLLFERPNDTLVRISMMPVINQFGSPEVKVDWPVCENSRILSAHPNMWQLRLTGALYNIYASKKRPNKALEYARVALSLISEYRKHDPKSKFAQIYEEQCIEYIKRLTAKEGHKRTN